MDWWVRFPCASATSYWNCFGFELGANSSHGLVEGLIGRAMAAGRTEEAATDSGETARAARADSLDLHHLPGLRRLTFGRHQLVGHIHRLRDRDRSVLAPVGLARPGRCLRRVPHRVVKELARVIERGAAEVFGLRIGREVGGAVLVAAVHAPTIVANLVEIVVLDLEPSQARFMWARAIDEPRGVDIHFDRDLVSPRETLEFLLQPLRSESRTLS